MLRFDDIPQPVNRLLEQATVLRQAANTLGMDVEGVKVELLRHAYRMLQPPETIDGIHLLSLPDSAAMKVNALANRGSKKDFFDIAELMLHVPLSELLEFFRAKYQQVDPFTVIRSMVWFEDAESEPDPVPLRGWDWTKVKAECVRAVSRL